MSKKGKLKFLHTGKLDKLKEQLKQKRNHFESIDQGQVYESSHPEVFCEKFILRNSQQILQENTCARVSFLITLQASARNLI